MLLQTGHPLKPDTMPSKPKSFFERTSHPYYIASPAFRQSSGGVRALHYFCHALNESGHEAYIATEPGGTSPHLRTPELTQEVIKQHKAVGCVPIGVYPEVAHGNMLNLAVVARWILNKPGHLGGETSYGKEEILFYWDEWMIDSRIVADKLNIPIIDRRIFNAQGAPSERKGFCYYANKYFRFGGEISRILIQDGTSLCLNIPRSPQEIAGILRGSEAFYCYEPSSLVLEALACGCPVALIDTPYLNDFKWDKNPIFRIKESEIGKIKPPEVDSHRAAEYFQRVDTQAWLQIENFIEKTQTAARIQAERQRTPAYRLQEAINAFHNNEIEPATKALASLLEALPENPLPPAYLAFICATQGLPNEANEFITKAQEIAPERTDLLAGLGECFLKAGQPESASHYLEEAVRLQPDMLSAYPALARSLHLTQHSDRAIALLESAATMPSAAQANIQSTLLEIFAQQGKVAEFSSECLRHSKGIADDLLAARCLARFDATGERVVEALSAAQQRLSQQIVSIEPRPLFSLRRPPPWKIAFILDDFAQEQQRGRLAALLQHLPPEEFVTALIINNISAIDNDFVQACSLVADHVLNIAVLDDATALSQINALQPDILIDLDGYGPTTRLFLLAQAQAGLKLLWGEIPLPALLPDWHVLRGELVADNALLPGINLPNFGEICPFPEIPILPPSAPIFGCLTPAIRIGPDGWKLFSEVMLASPDSTLLLNLKDLGTSAERFICGEFTAAGIDAGRLRFVHAHTAENLCQIWQEVQFGLAPPVDGGELALTTCLWMGRPFIALHSDLPWSKRPTALLECVGASDWIASSPEHYVNLSRRSSIKPNFRLREQMRCSGLADPLLFAQGFASTLSCLLIDQKRQTEPAKLSP